MQSFHNGQYSSSVNAYQTFVTLQKSGQPLQLNTRLQNYTSMGIEDIRASDTNMTAFGARFTIVFKQIIIANLSTQVVSSRPDSSQNTSTGTEQSTGVSSSTTNTHTTMSSGATAPPSAPVLPNPNPDWSSDPIAPSGYSIMP